MNNKQTLLRKLPAIDKLLSDPQLRDAGEDIPQSLVLEAAQKTIDALRQSILQHPDQTGTLDLSIPGVAAEAAATARRLSEPSLQPVINATGTLLHTNLGRAPLSDAALDAVIEVSRGYSNLEFDLEQGERGHRYQHLEDLLCRLTGAEAATVVNNNAGAVLLALSAMASGKEAIVSRGELVEIGGAFRIPDVMAAGGVTLREVGTTNKTHLRDYRNAIGDETGLLLKVHTSNYRIVGFSSSVPASDLVGLGEEFGLPVLEDLGSGMLLDLTDAGLPREPTVRETVAAGIDVVTFSGDKLLGGPQAGLIVGKRAAIETIRRHPLARALRIDKMTLAALDATLRCYLDPERALQQLPVLQMLQLPAQTLRRRCQSLATRIRGALGDRADLTVIPETSRIGGGALPLTELPGYAVALSTTQMTADQLAAGLRRQQPPIVGRIQDDRLLLNPRTLQAKDTGKIVTALSNLLGQP